MTSSSPGDSATTTTRIRQGKLILETYDSDSDDGTTEPPPHKLRKIHSSPPMADRDVLPLADVNSRQSEVRTPPDRDDLYKGADRRKPKKGKKEKKKKDRAMSLHEFHKAADQEAAQSKRSTTMSPAHLEEGELRSTSASPVVRSKEAYQSEQPQERTHRSSDDGPKGSRERPSTPDYFGRIRDSDQKPCKEDVENLKEMSRSSENPSEFPMREYREAKRRLPPSSTDDWRSQMGPDRSRQGRADSERNWRDRPNDRFAFEHQHSSRYDRDHTPSYHQSRSETSGRYRDDRQGYYDMRHHEYPQERYSSPQWDGQQHQRRDGDRGMGGYGRQKRFRSPADTGNRRDKRRLTCHSCGQFDHIARNCPKPKCKICRKEGHKVGDRICEASARDPQTSYVRCIKGRDDILSNFYPCEINVYNETFGCSENAYHYKKAVLCGEMGIARKFIGSKDAAIGKGLSKELVSKLPQNWAQLKNVVMRQVLKAKFLQVQVFYNELKKYTKPAWYLAHSLPDAYWGTGLSTEETLMVKPQHWPGKNMHGVMLDELREWVLTGNVPDNYRSFDELDSVHNRSAQDISLHDSSALDMTGYNTSAYEPEASFLTSTPHSTTKPASKLSPSLFHDKKTRVQQIKREDRSRTHSRSHSRDSSSDSSYRSHRGRSSSSSSESRTTGSSSSTYSSSDDEESKEDHKKEQRIRKRRSRTPNRDRKSCRSPESRRSSYDKESQEGYENGDRRQRHRSRSQSPRPDRGSHKTSHEISTIRRSSYDKEIKEDRKRGGRRRKSRSHSQSSSPDRISHSSRKSSHKKEIEEDHRTGGGGQRSCNQSSSPQKRSHRRSHERSTGRRSSPEMPRVSVLARLGTREERRGSLDSQLIKSEDKNRDQRRRSVSPDRSRVRPKGSVHSRLGHREVGRCSLDIEDSKHDHKPKDRCRSHSPEKRTICRDRLKSRRGSEHTRRGSTESLDVTSQPRNTSELKPKVKDCRERLNEMRKQQQKKQDDQMKVAVESYAKSKEASHSSKKRRQSCEQEADEAQPRDRCEYCSKTGHLSAECKVPACQICGEVGHEYTDAVCEGGLTTAMTNVRCIEGMDDVLSNFWPCRIQIFSHTFNCSANAYYYRKAIVCGEEETAAKFITAEDAGKGKEISKDLEHKKPGNWDDLKVIVMRKVLWEKYQQVEEFRKELKYHASFKWILAHTVDDQFWGTGLNHTDTVYVKRDYWPGSNNHGKILKEIRQYAETSDLHENLKDLDRKENELLAAALEPVGQLDGSDDDRPSVASPQKAEQHPDRHSDSMGGNPTNHSKSSDSPKNLSSPRSLSTDGKGLVDSDRQCLEGTSRHRRKRFRSPGGGPDERQPREHCKHCFKMDHLSKDCKEIVCVICHKPGHAYTDSVCEAALTEPMNNVRCVKGKEDILSNFWPCDIRIFGRTFNCSENAYHFRKAMISGDKDTAGKFIIARDAPAGKELAKELKSKLPHNWDDIKVVVIRKVMWQKYEQVPEFREELKRYPSSKWILAHTLEDRFWGTGLEKEDSLYINPKYWPGKNMHCVILNEIREYAETGKVHENCQDLDRKEEELLAAIVKPVSQIDGRSDEYDMHSPMVMSPERPQMMVTPERPRMSPQCPGQYSDSRHSTPSSHGWSPNRFPCHNQPSPLNRPPIRHLMGMDVSIPPPVFEGVQLQPQMMDLRNVRPQHSRMPPNQPPGFNIEQHQNPRHQAIPGIQMHPGVEQQFWQTQQQKHFGAQNPSPAGTDRGTPPPPGFNALPSSSAQHHTPEQQCMQNPETSYWQGQDQLHQIAGQSQGWSQNQMAPHHEMHNPRQLPSGGHEGLAGVGQGGYQRNEDQRSHSYDQTYINDFPQLQESAAEQIPSANEEPLQTVEWEQELDESLPRQNLEHCNRAKSTEQGEQRTKQDQSIGKRSPKQHHSDHNRGERPFKEGKEPANSSTSTEQTNVWSTGKLQETLKSSEDQAKVDESLPTESQGQNTTGKQDEGCDTQSRGAKKKKGRQKWKRVQDVGWTSPAPTSPAPQKGQERHRGGRRGHQEYEDQAGSPQKGSRAREYPKLQDSSQGHSRVAEPGSPAERKQQESIHRPGADGAKDGVFSDSPRGRGRGRGRGRQTPQTPPKNRNQSRNNTSEQTECRQGRGGFGQPYPKRPGQQSPQEGWNRGRGGFGVPSPKRGFSTGSEESPRGGSARHRSHRYSSKDEDYDDPVERQKRRTVGLSRFLSKILRHAAADYGFTLDKAGFLYVDELLDHPDFIQRHYTWAEIKDVVDNNDKRRFDLQQVEGSDRWKIRATQGHSVQIEDLGLTPITDPTQFAEVVHGTYYESWCRIEKMGLSCMRRTHIHFAPGEPGMDKVISGMRSTCQVIIYLDMAAALADGIQFFVSKNNVILTTGDKDGSLSPKYFKRVIDRETRSELRK